MGAPPQAAHRPPLRGVALAIAGVRTTLFVIVAWLFVALFALTLPLLPLLGLRQRYAVLTRWSRITLRWLKWLCGLDYRVRGGEALPDRPSVIISNHQSAWETLAFQSIFPPHVWVLKRSLLRIPLFGWCLGMLRPVAIERSAHSKALRQVVSQGQARLDEGMWVVVFPEGTRMPAGTLGAFNPGGVMLAERAGVPIVPVVHNAGAFWPRRGYVIRPGTIDVEIGAPIDPAGDKPKAVTARIEAWMAGRLPELGHS